MLRELAISNILLIDKLQFEIGRGMTAITGETGAGKSIILDCIAALVGQVQSRKKKNEEWLRDRSKSGVISAVFDITGMESLRELCDENGIDISDGELMLRRTISPARSKIYACDTPISQPLADKIGSYLLEIHGQNSSIMLRDAALQREMTDSYAKADREIAALQHKYIALQHSRHALKDYEAQIKQLREEEEWLRHAVEELAKLSPKKDEYDVLQDERAALRARRQQYESFSRLLYILHGEVDITDIIYSAQRHATRMIEDTRGDAAAQQITEISDSLESAGISIDEAVSALETVVRDAEIGDNEQDRIEERLFSFQEMARKHRCAPQQLADIYADFAAKLELIDTDDSKRAELEAALASARNQYIEADAALQQKRNAAAQHLEARVREELAYLKMPKADFKLSFTLKDENKWDEYGRHDITFMLRANPGLPYAALQHSASGGENSRMMLALKTALAELYKTPTLIFDEIDSGVSGMVSHAMGLRMRALAQHHQIITITHQPQIAALADRQISVHKIQSDDDTKLHIQELEGKPRTEAIAHMICGVTLTDEAIAAAQQLLSEAS